MTGHVPNLYRAIIRARQRDLDALIELGVFRPFFLHHFVIYVLLLLLPLLISRHAKISSYIRGLAFVVILNVGIEVIKYRRALFAASGYVIGLLTAWWIIWAATLLFSNDPERNFRRIERKVITSQESRNGTAESHVTEKTTSASSRQNAEHQREVLVWQPYPESLSHRLDWTLGLVFNMRGPEWNWRVSSFGPLPSSVFEQLSRSEEMQKSNSVRKPARAQNDTLYPEAKAPLKSAFTSFITSYIALDIVKTLMMRDLYFWGFIQSPPPFPLNYFTSFPISVLFCRQILSGFGLISALTLITSLNPIIFYGLSRAFPRTSRKLTFAPLDAPWIYTSTFGPFLSAIMDFGLAGCWGRWWHQLFRFGFLSTAHALLTFLFPHKIATFHSVRKATKFIIAFGISAIIHTCGSYTQPSQTSPLSGPFMFFLLQVPGIMIQGLFHGLLTSIGLPPRLFPRWLRRAANFAFVVFWLMISGKSIVDDFAAGQIWLTEPIPVSLLRGLGFGAEGEGWWCWREPWFRIRSDGTWWGTGLQIL